MMISSEKLGFTAMPHHHFFITPPSILSTKRYIQSCKSVLSTQTPYASTTSPKSHGALLAPHTLAQTSRIAMSAFQLSTFATSFLVNPLYTHDIRAILPTFFPIIRALGLANLSTAVTLHHHRSAVRSCRLANAISFATTAALYLTSPLKPAYVNIPFTSTLTFVAILNAVSLSQLPESQTETVWHSAQVAKFATAVATFVEAFFTAGQLPRVYLLQIALNLAVAATVAFYGRRMSRFMGFVDAVILSGMAACLACNGSFISSAFVVISAVYAGMEVVLSVDS